MAEPSLRRPIALVAVLLLAAFATYWALNRNDFQDFFIYRAGAEIGLRGESPHDAMKIRAAVARQFPESETLIENCGFFLPPQAIVLFAPFAMLPYDFAKLIWAGVNGLAALTCLLLPRLFRRSDEEVNRLGWLPAILPFAILLAPTLTLPIMIVGQTTIVFLGAVIAGQWCFDKGRPILGSLLWAIPFVKPHLALPLIAVAWYLGGWKRAVGVLASVGILNLAGCLIAGGSPLFFREYVEFLGSGHKAVIFNRVEMNPQVTSWNRLLFACGGPLIELTAWSTLAGYAIWFGLILGRCALRAEQPTGSWAMAAAMTGALLCCQVLGYETLILALVLPWCMDLFLEGRRVLFAAIGVILATQWIPQIQYRAWVESMHLDGQLEMFLFSTRSIGVAVLATLILISPAKR